jgi:hypothetical protein
MSQLKREIPAIDIGNGRKQVIINDVVKEKEEDDDDYANNEDV